MSTVDTLGLVVGLVAGLGVGCNLSIDEDCQPGTEGCPCTAELQCLTGLTCLSSYCVDPNGGDDGAGDATAGDDGRASDGGDTGDDGDAGDTGNNGDDGTGDGGTGNGDDNDNDAGDNGGAIDNVGACEEWIDASECGEYDWSSVIDCSIYADLPCNISAYFNCLTDNTSCVEGIPDTSGWANCYELATCV